ncbi:MAG: Mor transcription activator family protein [Methylococcaceae bacterium]
MSLFPDNYPDILIDMHGILVHTLGELSILDNEKAHYVALSMTEAVRKHYSGTPLYIPKGKEMEISKRDNEIFEKFTYKNHGQLARDYGLTVHHIYRIVKKMGKSVRTKVNR